MSIRVIQDPTDLAGYKPQQHCCPYTIDIPPARTKRPDNAAASRVHHEGSDTPDDSTENAAHKL